MSTDVDRIGSEVSAEQARALTDRIKVAVDGTWLLIQDAYTSRAWAALGYASWDDYCTREFGTSRLRLPREERQEVVASLREIGMSVRAIAAATSISPTTVVKDLGQALQTGTPASIQGETAASPQERPVVGTDGKTYRGASSARSTGYSPRKLRPLLGV